MLLVLGIVLGVGIAILVSWIRSKSITVKWYEWLMGIIALLLALLGVQHFLGSISIEGEPTAGWLGLLVFEGIALLLIVFNWQMVVRRSRKV